MTIRAGSLNDRLYSVDISKVTLIGPDSFTHPRFTITAEVKFWDEADADKFMARLQAALEEVDLDMDGDIHP